MPFSKKFFGRSKYAQPAETSTGEWAQYLEHDAAEKVSLAQSSAESRKIGTVLGYVEIAGFAAVGTAVLIGAAGLLLTGNIPGFTIVLGLAGGLMRGIRQHGYGYDGYGSLRDLIIRAADKTTPSARPSLKAGKVP